MNARRIFVVLMCVGSLLSAVVLTGVAGAAPVPSPDLACPPCDDGSFCTVDTCDQVTGTCEHTPVVCDDSNPCTTDSCEPSAGCVFEPLPEGTACDDDNACTLEETCDASARCAGQSEAAGVACDDHNSCTDADTCDGAGGCAGLPLTAGTECEDGDLCTVGDTCVETTPGSIACVGSPNDCADFGICTRDSCDPATGSCVHTQVVCPDDGNGCTADFCSQGAGGCTHATLVGSPCDDHNLCTTMDRLGCQNNTLVCFGGPPRICDPGDDPCVHESCNPSTGCVFTRRDCEDGNPCTDNGICTGGTCPTPRPRGGACDDQNPCTSADQCVPDSTVLFGVACHGTTVDCDDGIACTADACDPATGQCTHTPSQSACDDGNPCTTDACDVAIGGCTHANNTGPCDDANACTTGDSCADGICSGVSLCDDHDRCTDDSCADPATGECAHAPVACDDGNACTQDSCDQATGQCVHAPVACDDGNACTQDSCDQATGQCLHSPAPGSDCDDGNVCTTDACDPATGACTHAANTAPCNDGNVCTTSDTCSDGFCGGAVPLDCDDGKECTIDSCHPVTGCRHAFDARLPDSDADGIPDSCDNCPAAVNRRQDDCNGNGIGDACDPSLYDLRIRTTSPLGKGSGEVLWSTACETDLRGFNVLMIDNQGNRIRLNTVPIPCSECITGGSGSYSTLIPKHKSGRNVFLEVLYRTSSLLTVGPATKE